MTLCRDCLREDTAPRNTNRWRCAGCGSPRGLMHLERDTLTVAHVDCDAFYAAVEQRDNPALRSAPLIIGGARRGVVSTCCYIARTFGVRSAMPMFKALELCPGATVVKPDMAKYANVGRQIRALMLELTPLVEPLSIDEAFLDLAGTQRLHDASPALSLARLARRIETEIGVSVSVGLSYCKFLAKVASDFDKPRGFAIIGRAEAQSFLRTRPVSLIWGVGKAAQKRLARDGVTRIGDLQDRGEASLMRNFGAEGRRLHQLSMGVDARAVSPRRETKSVSAETTFDEDIADRARLERELFTLCEKVHRRLRSQGCCTAGVSLKLKTSDFRLRSRAVSGFAPTQLAGRLFEAGRALLAREADGTHFRLIGIGSNGLLPADEADRGDLADAGVVKEKAAEDAIDRLRERFGQDAVVRGRVFGGRHPVRHAARTTASNVLSPKRAKSHADEE